MNRKLFETVCVAALLATGGCGFSQARLLPLATGENINRSQPFDRKVNDPTLYDGAVYFIWGARNPQNPLPAVGAKYQPYSRDPDRTHTLDWYRRNHPDWVEYTNDRTTPAYGFKYTRGNVMPIDINNPAVREWYWSTCIEPYIQAGYPMFAFDNIDLQNGEKRLGHFDVNGKWRQDFSGARIDHTYQAAVLDWVRYLCTRLHDRGIGVAANITYPLGRPELEPPTRQLLGMVDLWADEQGFTAHKDRGISDGRWLQKFNFIRSVETICIHWAVNETTSQHLADASQQQIDWAVANYYLYRAKSSLLTVAGAQQYGVYLDTPAMHVSLGRPTGVPIRQDSGAWMRTYNLGIVAVNPSSTRLAEIRLPPGRWIDSNYGEHEGKLVLTPVSGAMLVRKVLK